MDKDGFSALHSRVEEAYAKYRGSGFGLMTTIVSLSAGGIVAAFSNTPGVPKALATAFYFPILGALVQQYCSYMAQRRDAESAYEQLNVFFQLEMKIIESISGTKDDPGALKTAFHKRDASNWWYGWADYLCIATVIAFCVIFLITVLYLACGKNA